MVMSTKEEHAQMHSFIRMEHYPLSEVSIRLICSGGIRGHELNTLGIVFRPELILACNSYTVITKPQS